MCHISHISENVSTGTKEAVFQRHHGMWNAEQKTFRTKSPPYISIFVISPDICFSKFDLMSLLWCEFYMWLFDGSTPIPSHIIFFFQLHALSYKESVIYLVSKHSVLHFLRFFTVLCFQSEYVTVTDFPPSEIELTIIIVPLRYDAFRSF